MTRLKKVAATPVVPENKDLNENCSDKFICEHRGKGTQTSFDDFRKYILHKFQSQLKAIPGLREQMADFGGEPEAVVRLYHDVWSNFMYDLDSDDYSYDLESNLEENYMHDYLLDMKSKKLY